jgi:pimeloyl-ACP methyl ester carboxylesterase
MRRRRDARTPPLTSIGTSRNTHLLADRLRDAQLKIYPDAGHGFLFQYPAEFAREAEAFLVSRARRGDVPNNLRRSR